MLDNLKALIIETSAVCNLRCKMCPTLNYLDFPSEFGIMSDNIFFKTMDFENELDIIALEGWGEPLLDKKIVERVVLAKMKAKKVVFTSNLVLLTEEIIIGLNKSGLDVLNVSLDGGSRAIYEQIRTGAYFEDVVKNLEMLKKFATFDYHSTFVLSQVNKMDIFNYLELSSRFGFKQTMVKALDVITTEESKKMALSKDEMQNICRTAEKYIIDNKLNIELRTWNIFDENIIRTDCLAGVCEAAFVSYTGEVYPCCMLSHAVETKREMILNSARLEFGNLNVCKLAEIWNSLEYQIFREDMKKHIEKPSRCGNCMLF